MSVLRKESCGRTCSIGRVGVAVKIASRGDRVAGIGGFSKVIQVTARNFTILVIVSFKFRGRSSFGRHEVQSFVGWPRRTELEVPKSTVSNAGGILTSRRDSSSRELRGKRLGVSFDLVHEVVAGGFLKLRFTSL